MNRGSQPGSHYGGVDVPWRGAIPARPAYLPRSPKNARTTVRRFRDNIIQEHCMERVQSLSESWHILRYKMGNQTDCAWDDVWDEPVVE